MCGTETVCTKSLVLSEGTSPKSSISLTLLLRGSCLALGTGPDMDDHLRESCVCEGEVIVRE